MEKQALEQMRVEFPEVWTGMITNELRICLHALEQKAELINRLETKKKQESKNKKRNEGYVDDGLMSEF